MSKSHWTIDGTHSGIQFSVRHMVVSKVKGRFATYEGNLELDDDLTGSKVEVRIDTRSIDTGVADRDAHLRSADFFDAERFPALTFHSTRIEKWDDEHYRVLGELTIRDVTREVALQVEYGGRGKDPWGNERVGFSAHASVDRREFGLVWNQVLDAGGVLVGDRVEIEIELEAIKAAARSAA
jgi:polyisoprenoid-binding protein YceI